MGKFTVIPQDAFDALQLDAGVLLKRFDPENPVAPADEDLICATTGGINPSCVPTYSDFGSDVDNVPNNMMEFKHLDSWDAKLSTTGLGTSPYLIQLALGCADIDPINNTKVIPRMDLLQSDFKDIWWVGDKANGGLVAIQLKNALSTGGFSLQTTKNGKGTVALEITGHVSIKDQKTVPMVFYSMDPSDTTVADIVLDRANLNLIVAETFALAANVSPVEAEITWTSSDDTVATVSETGLVTAVAEGSATITATITVDSVDYSDTCVVTVSAGA